MAVITISNELIKEQPGMIQAMREHYNIFRRLWPRLPGCRTYEVGGNGIPEGDVVITPTITLVDGEYVFITEM